MPETLGRVADFLIAHRGKKYCDDCLAVKLKVSRKDAVKEASTLGHDTDVFKRDLGKCEGRHVNDTTVTWSL